MENHHVKNIGLTISYIIHMLGEIFLCIYIFILPAKYDLYYVSYIFLLASLKLIFKYECIISYFDKIIVDPNYILGANPKHVPYKEVMYNNSFYFMCFLTLMIWLNLIIIFLRNKSMCIHSFCIVTLILSFFVEYKINYLL
jgi:hypothetical protein